LVVVQECKSARVQDEGNRKFISRFICLQIKVYMSSELKKYLFIGFK